MICRYLRSSFLRRPLRHFSLFWIMLCAFLLPLVVSTYRDSLEYGTQLQIDSISKGYAIHILEAGPEDIKLFRNIDGLTDPVYEDGTIYLSYASEEFWKKSTDLELKNSMSDEEFNAYFTEELRIWNAIDSAVEKSSHSLHIVGYAYDMWEDAMEDSDLEVYMQKIVHLNIALLLFSGVIVYSAYGNHITGFSQETADLCALGATKGQIVRLFLVEFGVIFPLAAAGAVCLSRIVMRYLYEHFLGNTTDSVAIWEVFYMNPRNTALEILFYFLVCLCALAVSLMHRPRSRRCKQPRTQSAPLPVLWVFRTKPPIVRCLLILVPLVTAFLLLFNRYLSIYTQNVYSMEEAKIVVVSGESGFSQEELRIAEELAGAGRMEQFKDIHEPYLLISSEGKPIMASIHSYRDFAPQSPPLEKYEIAADLPEGETALGVYHLEGIYHSQEQIEVTLTRIAATGNQDPWNVNVYISDALMQDLMADAPLTRLEIYTSFQSANVLESALREHMPRAYQVSNFQNLVDTNTERQIGRLLLLSWIFCILMLVAMQIIWVRIAAYVRSYAPMLKILFQLGGSHRQLVRLIPVWFGVASATVLPFLIAIPWARMEATQAERPFIVSGLVLCIYAVIAVLTVVIFWLPVKYTLHQILKTRNK